MHGHCCGLDQENLPGQSVKKIFVCVYAVNACPKLGQLLAVYPELFLPTLDLTFRGDSS